MSLEQNTIVEQALEPLHCPTEGYLRMATTDDAENLFFLINKAYFQLYCQFRREGLEKRLETIDQIHDLMEKGIFLLITASDRDQSMMGDLCPIAACVLIHHTATNELSQQTIDGKTSIEISLLAVHPNLVKRGIARYMMQAVEAVAKRLGYTHIFLSALSLSEHVIKMYSHWGFTVIRMKTLTEEGIDASTFAIPCHIVIMEKKLQ